ncbi:TauD/TfdA family dioxygenase [Klebsiella aerogenes]|nr:TauD/TfdA family dioxygenase [Klebsiella aerogenes]ELI7202161.1 TauD/TfdA family dioxygenase [Klebsiella aerogenes]KLF02063.1 hypothetical protein YA24_12770 [Klebsiella aerogenes]
MELKALSPSFGLEISNVNLRNISADDMTQLKQLLYDKKLLVFRSQNLEHNSYLGFAEKLGGIAKYHFSSGLPDYPQIVQIMKRPDQTVNYHLAVIQYSVMQPWHLKNFLMSLSQF